MLRWPIKPFFCRLKEIARDHLLRAVMLHYPNPPPGRSTKFPNNIYTRVSLAWAARGGGSVRACGRAILAGMTAIDKNFHRSAIYHAAPRI